MIKDKIIITGTLLTLILILFVKTFSEGQDYYLKTSNTYYKRYFLAHDGRIIDYQRGGITTSEGQSYMMIRSVLMEEKSKFDLVHNWNNSNIKRKDNLFAWLWGEDKNGNYSTIDWNSASDADIDIAFALILAYEKWHKQCYLEEAKAIINSIWNNETKIVNGCRVLMPGVNQTSEQMSEQDSEEKIEINPSYFSPYQFKLFCNYDKEHDWTQLADSSYYFLKETMKKTKTGLPPDWFEIQNGEIIINNEKGAFSYDAVRVFQRVYVDYALTGDKRALEVLENSKFLATKWKESGKFYVNYLPDGQLKNKDEFIGAIAALLPAISIYDKKYSQLIYKKKITKYLTNKIFLESKNDYYGKNLAWFGAYIYDKYVNKNE